MTSWADIASLDRALEADGEDVTLRRPVGSGANLIYLSVVVRAKVMAVSVQEVAAGIAQTELKFVMSPTQIDAKQWPGGSVPKLPPFDVDQRIPRASTDQIIARGKVRTITFVDPVLVNGDLVRINGRMAG